MMGCGGGSTSPWVGAPAPDQPKEWPGQALPWMYDCALAQACRATTRPRCLESRSPCSKWIPPYRREMPAWSDAFENVGQDSVRSSAGTAPGSTLELPAGNVTEPAKRSDPVKIFRISAPAPLKQLCPEGYSTKGGVGKVVGWYGNHVSPSISLGPWYGPAQPKIFWPKYR